MDVKIVRSNGIWRYDPSIDGYSDGDFFATLSGTPSVSSGKLVLNSAAVKSRQSFNNCSVEFLMSVPSAPSSGDSRQWGFYDNSAVYVFDVSNDAFSVKVYYKSGSGSKTVNWNSSWTGADKKYRVSFSERSVIFAVGDVIVGKFEDGVEIKASTQLKQTPVHIYVSNGNADNLTITSINVV